MLIQFFKNALLCLFFSAIFISPQARQLTHENVEKKLATIKKINTHRRYALAFFTALGLAYNVSCILPLYYFFSGTNKPLTNEAVTGHLAVSSPYDCNSLSNNMVDLFCTKNGLLRIAKALFYFGGLLSSLCVVQKLIDDLNHPDTLAWYVKANVPYKKTTYQIKKVIMLMHNEPFTGEKLCHYQRILKTLYSRLLFYGESICAYMLYKSKESEFSPEQQMMAVHMSEHLFSYHNQCLRSLFDHFSLDVLPYQKVGELIATYELELAQQLDFFSGFESNPIQQ